MQYALAIGVSPPMYRFDNPVPGTEYHVEFDFKRNDGGSITYEKRIEGMVSQGDPGYDEEKLWYDSIILPSATEENNWESTTNTVVISGVWPDFIVPGQRKVFISGLENDEVSGTFGGIASVAGLIIVDVPYDGQFLKVNVGVSNVPPNEEVILNYTLESIGTTPIEEGHFEFQVYSDGELIEAINGDYNMLNATHSEVSLGIYDPGFYVVEGKFHIGDLYWSVTEDFIVANNMVDIVCPDLIYSAGIHQMEFPLSSGYLTDLDANLYFKIDGQILGEDILTLYSLQDSDLGLFVDLSDKEDGESDYSLGYGDYAFCSGVLTVKNAESAEIPLFVYVVVGTTILLVVVLSALYYLRRDEDSEVEF